MPSRPNSPHLSHPKYRADIDGLRAIAVLSVVGYHAFPNWIKGGFIGVDIFFVISGFLISTIIFENLKSHRFSFVEFYSRRIARIFPALILVLIGSYAFGWFALLADEYRQLGKHIAGGAGFVSNYLLWNENGYFDNAADTKPLLHLWSLGIEEQFYIVWPLFLWFAWKQRLSFLTITIAVGTFSFALNIGKLDGDMVAAFYSPQTRFWELLSGAVLAHFKLRAQVSPGSPSGSPASLVPRFVSLRFPVEIDTTLLNAQSALGVLLIAVGFLFITQERQFPGWWALLPTAGTVLVISAGARAWINRTFLSNRILVWFGLISFPLYLWHWPLLSFLRVIEGSSVAASFRIATLFIAVLLAWLTYRFIEKPIRFGRQSGLKTATLILAMAAVGAFGFNCYLQDGFEGVGFREKAKSDYARYFRNTLPELRYFENNRISEKFRFECDFYDLEKYRVDQATKIPRKEIGEHCFKRDARYSHAVLIWGDSHAQSLYPGLKNTLPKNWQILQVTSSGCAPDITATEPSTSNHCVQSNWFALKTIRETKPNTVIVGQNLGHDSARMNEIANAMNSLGVNTTIFTGPTPHWTKNLPAIIVRDLWNNTPNRTYFGIDKNAQKDNAKLKEHFAQTDSKRFVSIIDFFCDQSGCLTHIGDDKKLGITSWDYGHLTPIASELLAKNLLTPIVIDSDAKTFPLKSVK